MPKIPSDARPNAPAAPSVARNVAAGSARGRPTAERSAAISEDILDAAADLFLRDGYEQTSMEAVALRAGVPKTTLYGRYRDKRELAQAVLIRRVEAWSRRSRPDESGAGRRDALERHVSTMLLWATTPEVRAYTRLAVAASDGVGPSGLPTGFFAYGRMVDLLEEAVSARAAPRVIGRDSARRVARAIMALVAGALDDRAWSPPSVEEASEEARYVVGLIVGGAAAW